MKARNRYAPWIVGATAAITVSSAAGAQAQFVRDDWSTDFDTYTVPVDSLYFFGGKNAIPELSMPAYESVESAADWMGRRDPVAVVTVNGAVRAYPVPIIMRHDVVNDTLGGRPILMTYCILCGSAMAYDRNFDGQVLQFAVSGGLYNSNLTFYDLQTETWWAQAVGRGLVGQYAGQELPFIGAPIMNFRNFSERYPDATVLSHNTGFDIDYSEGRMAGYDERGPIERIFRREADVRLPPKERVMTLERGDDVVAVPYRALSRRRVIEVEVGGENAVVFWAPGTASVYADRVADGRDVGAAIAYNPRVQERHLTFTAAGDGVFEDRQTHSSWNITGLATDGPLAGTQLETARHAVHFWFVWAAYRPNTRVIER